MAHNYDVYVFVFFIIFKIAKVIFWRFSSDICKLRTATDNFRLEHRYNFFQETNVTQYITARPRWKLRLNMIIIIMSFFHVIILRKQILWFTSWEHFLMKYFRQTNQSLTNAIEWEEVRNLCISLIIVIFKKRKELFKLPLKIKLNRKDVKILLQIYPFLRIHIHMHIHTCVRAV